MDHLAKENWTVENVFHFFSKRYVISLILFFEATLDINYVILLFDFYHKRCYSGLTADTYGSYVAYPSPLFNMTSFCFEFSVCIFF